MDKTTTTTTQKIGNYRWRILALLFMATTINYIDRSILGVLGPTLRDKVFGWTVQDYANITISFQLAYAIGLISMGGIIDKLGTKKGYTLSIAIWSAFGMLHALVTRGMGWIGFAAARFGLGIGEAGNFPSAIKTVAEWFPKKERALASGIFNAGTNVGAIIAPLFIPLIVASDGTNWQYAFLVTGVFSLLWIFLWNRYYQKPEVHPKVNQTELDYILSDPPEPVIENLPWRKLLPVKETWAFAAAKTADAVWWFYLFWGGFFLNARFGLELKGLALPLIVIYLIADVGSIFGGYLSGAFIKRGWTVNKSRKITLLLCAICVLPVTLAPIVANQWVAVLLIALAAASHQAWSANAFTLVSDVFPKQAVASVVGIGGMWGAVSGIIANFALGKVLTHAGPHGYVYAFLVAGCVYLIALAAVQLIMPKMTPVKLNA
ncbi:MAG: MFS transporter [Bacteroidales bacterium]|nr:MFS transporter [Bacteroidales bacterium]